MRNDIKPSTERQRFWHEHLRRCDASGRTVAAYAQEHGLAAGSLYEARRTLKSSAPTRLAAASADASPRFVRVVSPVASSLPCRAHLRNGVVVEFGVNADQLGLVLTILSQLP